MFKEIVGDMFKLKLLNPDAICITTNCIVKKNGCAVMGAGVAKRALEEIPGIDKALAMSINEYGHYVNEIYYWWDTNEHATMVVSFPTKYDWAKPSSLYLIEESCRQIVDLADIRKWKKVIIPRPGCSNGGRHWLSEVKPILEKYLDERFYIIRKA